LTGRFTGPLVKRLSFAQYPWAIIARKSLTMRTTQNSALKTQNCYKEDRYGRDHPAGAGPLRAQPDRLSTHRRRAHRFVQLAVRPALRRPVHPARRGYRREALRPWRGQRYDGFAALGRAGVGRGAGYRRPVRTIRPVRAA